MSRAEFELAFRRILLEIVPEDMVIETKRELQMATVKWAAEHDDLRPVSFMMTGHGADRGWALNLQGDKRIREALHLIPSGRDRISSRYKYRRVG